MKKCRITVMKKAAYPDLAARYENPIEHACDLEVGRVFYTDGWEAPAGLCESAWRAIAPYAMILAHGGENLYDGWMKDPRTAMISCSDGFRPVSFLIEALDPDAE